MPFIFMVLILWFCYKNSWAARRNQTEVCEYLIRNGIDIDCQDKDGQTALHFAATFDRLAAARLLVEFGANKDIRNLQSKTAAEVATSNPMKILLQSKWIIVLLFHIF
jgi:ankyrin repeat protein